MITSHLDENEASDPTLKALGEQRYEAIKTYFMENGIRYTRILTEDKRDAMPADQSGTDLGKSQEQKSYLYLH